MRSWSRRCTVDFLGFPSPTKTLIDPLCTLADARSPRCNGNPGLQLKGTTEDTREEVDLNSHSEKSSQDLYPVLVSLFGNCAKQKALGEGRKFHCLAVCCSLDRRVLLGNLLIKMYDVCGQIWDARSVFDRMKTRNVITWTLIVNSDIHHGYQIGALHRFREMQIAGVRPNDVTLVSILAATSLDQGMVIHSYVVEYGFDTFTNLETALINMYRKSGCLENIRWIFDRMGSRDVVAWNTLIAAYSPLGRLLDCVQLYLQMRQTGVEPNCVTFITLLSVCCNHGTTLLGFILHSSIMEAGFELDDSVGSSLVTMYSNMNSVEEAQVVFRKTNSASVVMWNAIITAHVESGHHNEALSLYEEMIPNKKNLDSHSSLGTALLNLYGKCGSVQSARRIFDRLLSRDLITWNAMLSVYVLNKHEQAFEFYRRMRINSMLPDTFTFNTLLVACCQQTYMNQGLVLHNDIILLGVERRAGIGAGLIGMYNKLGLIEAARNLFDEQDSQDVTLWNTMLAAYVQSDRGKEAILLYGKMGKQGIKPDEFTFSAVVSACANLAASMLGKVLHAAVVDGGFDSDSAVKNALVDMYGKCGALDDAWGVLKKHHDQNTVSWNALVSGYAQHGHGYEALHVFGRMRRQNIKANKVTFAGVFAGCAHVGLVDEGLELLVLMKEVDRILPDLEHYASIVDLFGRAGRIQEGENLINRLPVQPDIVVWKVILSCCRVHNDKCGGRNAAEHAIELHLQNTLSYILLSNLYAVHDEEFCIQ